ncbi:uncharacterized protein LOC119384937 [Rhipicephalus sanguineus]|uniref:Uncharacterized protein n=1 Tax=Rhipicephalus sanguineus TaxID=34632 RepID=A0A9D4T055_RHISA|nr:uncharacterized protein LOC119384937 [Rhipicephalus sanguineus]KAH7961317.1 hypothetical protein HPB52_007673 [Rhipicephalus sanguineus]
MRVHWLSVALVLQCWLLLVLLLSCSAADSTTLNSAGQSIHDIKGIPQVTKKGNPLLMLMEPALPALKYMLPLVALLALPELLSTALTSLRGIAAMNAGAYTVQARRRGRRGTMDGGRGGGAVPGGIDYIQGAQQMITLLTRLDEAVQRYGQQDASCQLKAMCEFHRSAMSPEAGTVAKNIISMLKADGRVERSAMPDDQKAAMQDFLKAAQNGLHQRNCSRIYSDCHDTTTT